MVEIDIPGSGCLRLEHLVLDVNGTLALDGTLLEGVPGLLDSLGKRLKVHLVTADTHGKQADIDFRLGLTATVLPPGAQVAAKLEYVRRLGATSVAAIGNGANDAAMVAGAGLGIAVVGPEGAAVETVRSAAIVVTNIRDALELLLHPGRLTATLRR